MKHIFKEEQQKKATFILESPLVRLSELYSNEIKDLAIVWCYYSGKIEGNTYTYVETEALLKDGITSEKKYEDAKILNSGYINLFLRDWSLMKSSVHYEHVLFVLVERSIFRLKISKK